MSTSTRGVPRRRWTGAIAVACLATGLGAASGADASTLVRFDTVLGAIDVRLYDSATPLTVDNFLGYVGRGNYTNTMIHRTSPGFVIQGGGWTYNGTTQVEPDNYPRVFQQTAVLNEPGISNLRGTIAMAKIGGDPNSATNQWFFNLGNNAANLDNQNGGFTAFGRVLGNGMQVVDAIAAVPRFGFQGAWNEAPMRNYTAAQYNAFTPVGGNNVVLINSVSVLNLLPGDYDRDGDVDNADLAVWQADYGVTSRAEADGNGDGVVDLADFTLWRDSFTGPLMAVAVPEPAGVALVGLFGLLIGVRRRGNR
ncbi:peptidylprolyl isomerase [Botrimarina hoheduenensis]|uniref:peptidylprolyl isomerase n=1 Tax=Botrimarina hoheduenensis TaxID=2528000 RepID=A0A5C5W0C9_9BACT|nr:peptidylprolyl isomerase [Botrimarina hoheduenensis]TWT43222.1 Peptidyl-prolyl cis-trans isomerase A precursor [Botrimarina hoheduenensis]